VEGEAIAEPAGSVTIQRLMFPYRSAEGCVAARSVSNGRYGIFEAIQIRGQPTLTADLSSARLLIAAIAKRGLVFQNHIHNAKAPKRSRFFLVALLSFYWIATSWERRRLNNYSIKIFRYARIIQFLLVSRGEISPYERTVEKLGVAG
jgi:hypothetical protein